MKKPEISTDQLNSDIYLLENYILTLDAHHLEIFADKATVAGLSMTNYLRVLILQELENDEDGH